MDSCMQDIYTLSQNTPRHSDVDDPMNHLQSHIKEHAEGHLHKYPQSFRPAGAQWDPHIYI